MFDTNALRSLGFYYPNRFPTIWERINELADLGLLRSVKEVQREIESNCPSEHVLDWVKTHHHIFMRPTEEELRIISEIFQKEQFRGIIKELPVADSTPVIARLMWHNKCL
ncbi:MAG: DUF4411 family protein [Planctomycetota bacterium]